MNDIEYAKKVLNEELRDQRDLLKDAQDEEHRKEIETRIEQLKAGIKILKEYEEER